MACACLAAALLGWWLFAVANADYAGDEFAGVSFHPFTLDPGNASCPLSTQLEGSRDCDPVNLLWPGRSLSAVVADFEAAGWSVGTGSSQSLAFADGGWTFAAQDRQLVLGTLLERYHVRLWQAPGPGLLVIGAVHHESGVPHAIDMDWDGAEARVRDQFCAAGCGSHGLAQQLAIQGGASWRGWGNDGAAAVIEESPPPPTPTATRTTTPTLSPSPAETATPTGTSIPPSPTMSPTATASPLPTPTVTPPVPTPAPVVPRAVLPALARG